MMRQMRENTKWIMLITALAFVALMVFEWGMDASGRSSVGMGGSEIGRVNGEKISYENFLNVYNGLYRQQQLAMDGPMTTAMTRQIEDAAWQQLIMQKLIDQELRRRGLGVTNTEIRQHARFAPPPEFMQSEIFLTDGRFDLNRYHQFLASPGTDNELLLQLETYYRETIPRSKLYYQVNAGLYITDEELWRMYRDRTETATARFVSIDPLQHVADTEVEVTDADVRAYYRANPTQFERDARASVRYVVLNRLPGAADSTAARQRVEALRAEIVGGADFADVAARESADSATARQGGELTITPGQTVPAFDAVAFSLPVGQVSDPVLTQYGYHLVRVDNRTAEQATIRHILVPIELTFDSEDHLFTLADSLEALGERLPLAEAAADLGLEVRTAEILGELPFLPGAGNAIDAAEWAFEDARPGDVSPVFESEAAYYMAELVSAQPSGVVPLEQASADIRRLLMNRKKIERAQQRVRETMAGATGADALARVAQAFDAPVQDAGPFTRGDFVPGLGRLNAAIGAAFGLPRGGVSGALEADEMVVVIQTIDRQDADRTAWEAQRDDQRRSVTPSLAEQRWEQFLAGLEERATIIDNRAQVLRGRGVQPSAPIAGF
jgi:peptidyl-prolyl cis-trans isomerase D